MGIWLIGILGFIIGLAAGVLLGRQFLSDSVKVRDLTNELDALKDTHHDYQQSVYSHFESTAEMMNKFTQTYREVYTRLARDAEILCPEEVTRQLALPKHGTDLLGENGRDSINQQMDDLFPPRDYATKTSPDQKGGLAADYGLEKKESFNP